MTKLVTDSTNTGARFIYISQFIRACIAKNVKAVSPKGRTKKFDFDEVYDDIKDQFIKK